MRQKKVYVPIEGFTYALNRAVKGRKKPTKEAINLIKKGKNSNGSLLLLFFDSFLGSNFSKKRFLELLNRENVTALTLKPHKENRNFQDIISLFGNDDRSIINRDLGRILFKEKKVLDYEILVDKFLEIYEPKPTYIFLDATTLRTENNPFYSSVLELFAAGFAVTLVHKLENSVLELILTKEVYNTIKQNLEESFFVKEYSNENKNSITLLISPYLIKEAEVEYLGSKVLYKENLAALLFQLPSKLKVKKRKIQPLKKISFEKLFNVKAFILNKTTIIPDKNFKEDDITRDIKIISRHYFNSWLVNWDFFFRIKDTHADIETKYFLYKKYKDKINNETFQILKRGDFLFSIRKNTFNIVYILEVPEYDNSLYIPNSKLAKFSPTPFLRSKINPLKLAIILSPLTNREFNKTISLEDMKQFVYEVTNLVIEQRFLSSKELLETFYSTENDKKNRFQEILEKYFK